MNTQDSLAVDESASWISFSDLMAGLLIVFILALAYSVITYTQKTAQITDNDRVRSELLTDIKSRLESRGITIEVDDEHGILRIPEGVLFESGSALVLGTDEDVRTGRGVLRVLSNVLFEVMSLERYATKIDTIFIEGHTDDVRISNDEFRDNWELSAQRAINAWKVLLEFEPRLANLRNEIGVALFSVSGYADTRSIEPNDNDGNRAKNRRIDVRFAIAPPRAAGAAADVSQRVEERWNDRAR